LNGLRFKAWIYEANQRIDSDVLFFRHDTLQSENWLAAGFHTATTGCTDHGVGVIRVKANMINAANEWRTWNFTIRQGKLDGLMSAGAQTGDYTMYTFAGEELP
jgi:hypothetical protein